ncbi:MAG: PD-(D/E)XK nuclease family protein [Bacteroidales bacterium]|jgi:CRISPR/Cas system-associated exonuclease Cas4 (RecB family)|nr:PD-(D/E)XK nuclease family protein [Bacteroidales bacterium]
MKPFLLQVAEYIKADYAKDLSNICIVVPGKRSIIFLKKHLAALYEKPFFAPAFFSIEEFFSSITGINMVKKEEQLLILYQIHLSLMAEKKEQKQEQTQLHEFSGHAQLMINDFNEIDISLSNTDILFSSLYSIKELSLFGKQEDELTDFQKNYLNFFKELSVYYKLFTNNLLQQNKGYQGLIYRKAAENISRYMETLHYSKYIFIGFNALTKAEEVVVEYLLTANRLDYLVDGDLFYTKDKIHEAGKFIRHVQKSIFKHQPLQFMGNYFAEIPKKIHITALPQSVMQAKFLNEILEQIQSSDNTLENTAVIPADETLLLPVLNSIDTTNANITMGYPVKRTVLYQLLSNYLIALENRDKFNRNSLQGTNIKLYHKDLFVFFNSPYIRSITKNKEDQTDIPALLQKKIRLFYAKKDYKQLIASLSPQLQTLFTELFYSQNTIGSICNQVQALLVQIQKNVSLNFIQQETLQALQNYMEELQNNVSQLMSINITSFRFLFENYISELSISFQSDATTGLQILGLLETRTLDFKNVILLSVNEGVLPTGKTTNSFIPYDVKTHFGLQTYKGRDAVFSYHFYRLLQRAENIYLLYSLDTKNGNMEKSRFIYQLKNELKSFANIEITEDIIAYPPIKPEAEMPVCIRKTENILAKLKQQKYSASSISSFLECELRFYFRYVLELEEKNIATVDDMLQSDTIGTVIHAVLEAAVENGRFKQITKTEIEQRVRTSICKNDKLNLTEEDLLYEKNYLVFQIIVKYIDAYMKYVQSIEKDFIIKQTEEKLEQTLLVNDTLIALKGFIDRVDLRNGVECIIDYKTGKLQDTELKLKDIETVFDGKHTKAFQLLFYAYLYCKKYKQDCLEAEIVSFRKIRTSYILSLNRETKLSENILDCFEDILIQVISSILDAETPFTPTPDPNKCKYCPYKDFCRK